VSDKKVQAPHENITYRIIGAAMAVHRRLGPGHKEDVYQRALEAEFEKVGLGFEAQKNIEVYDGECLVGYYIPDFIVEEKVIVEIKVFATLHQKYLGQVITYLNCTGLAIGLLINFGERSLRPRRVFPSPQTADFQINHQWLFVPERLKAERGQSV
jgi:GxxExxY protein